MSLQEETGKTHRSDEFIPKRRGLETAHCTDTSSWILSPTFSPCRRTPDGLLSTLNPARSEQRCLGADAPAEESRWVGGVLSHQQARLAS